MEQKQTAVDYAVEKLEKFISEGNQIVIDAILEKAKEMEKQHIIDANMAGQKFIGAVPGHYKNDAEDYYNDIFNKNN
jgi:hypothetical protein